MSNTIQKGHPGGLYLLFTVEMWERFSYYGMRAIFILYLTKALLMDTESAGSIYGIYTSLVYATPLLGGFTNQCACFLLRDGDEKGEVRSIDSLLNSENVIRPYDSEWLPLP